MKKFLIILIFSSLFLSGCGNNDTSIDNQNKDNDYAASRTTATDNNTNNFETSNLNIDNVNTETELSSFSTKIYTPNDEARQNNIRITCSKLNETVVKTR